MRLRTFLLVAGATGFAAYQLHRLVSHLIAPVVISEVYLDEDSDDVELTRGEADAFEEIADRLRREDGKETED